MVTGGGQGATQRKLPRGLMQEKFRGRFDAPTDRSRPRSNAPSQNALGGG